MMTNKMNPARRRQLEERRRYDLALLENTTMDARSAKRLRDEIAKIDAKLAATEVA